MCEIADKLQALITIGFRFAHPRNATGHVVAVTGVRTHHDVVDVFSLYGENAATAARMCSSEPDVLSPRNVLWRTSGTATSVIEALLTLAEPSADQTRPLGQSTQNHQPARRAERDRGCWVQTRPGRSTWLPATA
jgi:hypothetical protein